MFDYIGSKIKGLAKAVFIIEVIASVIVAIVVLAIVGIDGKTFMTMLLVVAFGALIAWISSWALYGFGIIVEFCENNSDLKYQLSNKSGGLLDEYDYKCPKCGRYFARGTTTCPGCGQAIYWDD